MAEPTELEAVVDSLTKSFLANHPREAAKRLQMMADRDAADVLKDYPIEVSAPVIESLNPQAVGAVMSLLPSEIARRIIEYVDPGNGALFLSRMEEDEKERLLSNLSDRTAREFRELIAYPADSAGSLMDTRISGFRGDNTVEEALAQLRERRPRSLYSLKIVDGGGRLEGVVEFRDLVVAEPGQRLSSISTPVRATVNALDPRQDVVARLEEFNLEEVPVVDIEGRLLGVIRHAALMDALRDVATTDIQTMVGVSKDERALSSSWFAVRKRMPWLQINLLTAFLAASVVGVFEDTIAKVTALAVLLPVVAGQSGNAGAQALAVTMRGLALREIRVGHWMRVTRKEVSAGFWNGLSIAATCALGVYLWSGSIGLVLVIALSMVLSMVAAGMAGALVPITLARLGQDPAVASSIVLTTVTDIVGFFSFLGIATVLSGMLVGA